MGKIHEAIRSRNINLLIDSIESGEDVNGRCEEWGQRPIDLAIYAKIDSEGEGSSPYLTNIEAVRILLTHPMSRNSINLNSPGKLGYSHLENGSTLMFVVASTDNVELLNLCYCLGGKIQNKDEDGYTPLRRALKCGAKKTAVRLIELGADVEYVKQQIKNDLIKLNETINNFGKEGKQEPSWIEKDYRRIKNQEEMLKKIIHEYTGYYYFD